ALHVEGFFCGRRTSVGDSACQLTAFPRKPSPFICSGRHLARVLPQVARSRATRGATSAPSTREFRAQPEAGRSRRPRYYLNDSCSDGGPASVWAADDTEAGPANGRNL